VIIQRTVQGVNLEKAYQMQRRRRKLLDQVRDAAMRKH